ncbi:MAG: hypothetical protein Q9215_007747 [Flavoplaca cf. flavocitrina]
MTVEDHGQNISLSPTPLHTQDINDRYHQQQSQPTFIHLLPHAPKRKHSAAESSHLSSQNDISNTSHDHTLTCSTLTSTHLDHPTAFGLDEEFLPPSTPSSSNPVLPLTTQNLHRFSQESEHEPVAMGTPHKSSISTGKLSTSKLASHIEDVRQILKLNGMPVQADGVLETYPQIMTIAQQLLEKDRHSPPPTKEQLAQIEHTRKKYASRNETTFVQKFFGVFNTVKREVSVQRDNLNLPAEWESRDWEQDGLDENDDKLLRDGSVPIIVPTGEAQKLILSDLPRISNPKPDILYGYDLASFTEDEALINAKYKNIASISEGIAHPFFDVEVKTGGDFEEAVGVACTGGAAMVQAHRRLQALVVSTDSKTKGSTYVDTSTMAYSMVLMPFIACIYVHWAEDKGERVVYHMHLAGSYAINIEKYMKECRAAVGNILDWGLGERRRAIDGLLQTIYERYSKKGAKGKGNSAEATSDGKDQPPASKKHRISIDEDDDDEEQP